MESMKTILIGGWPAFSEARGLNKKEVPEDFGWMSKDNAFFYSDMRAALDATPGSREFLLSLKPHDSHSGPLVDAVQGKMSSSHSGASISSIFGCYRAALKNWDTWVLASKHDMLMREYRQRQIDFISLTIFHNHLVYIDPPVTNDEGFKEAMEKANVTFSDGEKPVIVAWDNGAALRTVITLLDELTVMREEEKAKWKARQMKERIEYLEFNLKHPSRWFWSGECHPSYNITGEEMTEMERLHPGYRDHMALVCSHLHRFGRRAYWTWTPENDAILEVHLKELGILQ